MSEKQNDATKETTWPPTPKNELAEDVIFEAAALYRPVKGRETVQALMIAVSDYYARMEFTAPSAVLGDATYLQWEGTTPSGTELKGATVITRNAEGLISHIAVHQRPLGGLLEFSTDFGSRFSATGAVPADSFYQG
ncbi:nuclear transport factor 2 family protein [Streptomyces sp. NPDC088387]|uniref:nuclear transport factor 2 family protein n=1 Tax=Streptomyces sp. NPDC088387 TaxID=3365859 RepID=UPI00380B0F60